MNRKLILSAVVVAVVAAVAWVPPAAAAEGPQLDSVTLINGNLDTFMPGVGLAINLDTTPLVAGMTRYDSDGLGPHLVFNDTWAGFLWRLMPSGSQSPDLGRMQVFRLNPPSLYLTPSFYAPTGIADNQTVVGSVAFRETLTTAPWEWTASDGLRFLPLPDATWQGSALGVSADGATVGGTVFQRVGFRTITRAAQWNAGTLAIIGAPGSQASAISHDGRVVVGSAGGQAARWVNGVPAAMDPVANGSSASFASTDGATTVGTATVSPALSELVRWNAEGAAQVLTPPDGYSLDRITAINPDATAVVGSLVSYPDCTPGGPGPICSGNQTPFVWTQDRGFTVLPEHGLADFYDTSTAVDVSDDGNTVIGELSSSVQFDGSPKPTAFVWTRSSGQILLNTLANAAGYDYDLFGVVAISGSGHRIVATGAVHPPTDHDTSSVVLDISGLS